MKRNTRRMRVAIVGAGNVGSVLGRILSDNGAAITCIVSRSARSARKAGRFIGCRRTSTSLTSIPPETGWVYITTPHSAVEEVASSLARVEGLNFRRMNVCHASGMLTAAVLEPLRLRGATVFSFHPLQTFPRDFTPRRILPRGRGIYFGIDGPPAGLRSARRLARMLGGKVIEIPPNMRVFYHAACVVASNHLTALLSVLEVMYGRFGEVKREGFYRVFKPIVMATLNNIEATSPADALSGPIARGGIETVAQHFAAVKQFAPELIPYFAALSFETLRLAEAKGSLTAEQRQAMTRLIRSHEGSHLSIPEGS